MTPNPIKAALQRGETIIGMWHATGSPDLAEAAVKIGWNVLFLDNEHGIANLETAVDIHRAALAAGGDVIIRVPSADPVHLKRVLDRGFRSIMVPMVNSADEARALANACRYPPRGQRGYAAPIVRGSGWGTETEYTQKAHEELLLIAQIEHIDAVDDVAAIASVDGIDAIFIGPNDLAGSMGLLERLDDPRVLEACAKVEQETLSAGKVLGSIPRPGRSVQDLHDLGCRLVAGPGDIMIFLEGARAARKTFAFDASHDAAALTAAATPAEAAAAVEPPVGDGDDVGPFEAPTPAAMAEAAEVEEEKTATTAKAKTATTSATRKSAASKPSATKASAAKSKKPATAGGQSTGSASRKPAAAKTPEPTTTEQSNTGSKPASAKTTEPRAAPSKASASKASASKSSSSRTAHRRPPRRRREPRERRRPRPPQRRRKTAGAKATGAKTAASKPATTSSPAKESSPSSATAKPAEAKASSETSEPAKPAAAKTTKSGGAKPTGAPARTRAGTRAARQFSSGQGRTRRPTKKN